jgi:hypothetical protein
MLCRPDRRRRAAALAAIASCCSGYSCFPRPGCDVLVEQLPNTEREQFRRCQVQVSALIECPR